MFFDILEKELKYIINAQSNNKPVKSHPYHRLERFSFFLHLFEKFCFSFNRVEPFNLFQVVGGSWDQDPPRGGDNPDSEPHGGWQTVTLISSITYLSVHPTLTSTSKW